MLDSSIHSLNNCEAKTFLLCVTIHPGTILRKVILGRLLANPHLCEIIIIILNLLTDAFGAQTVFTFA